MKEEKKNQKSIITSSPRPEASVEERAEYMTQCQEAMNETLHGTVVVRSRNFPAVRIYSQKNRGINPGVWK